MEAFFADVRYAIRLLRKSPGFACTAIATLALGIGATTAIFSTVDTVLIRPLPYANPDRLVMVWEEASFAGVPRNTPAPGNYFDWIRRTRSFSDMAATRGAGASLTGDGAPEQLRGRRVTANFFSVLGVSPAIGRTFTDEEDRTGAALVIISHGLWQRRFGGDRSIVGRTLLLDDNRYEVIGVMPPGFVFRDREIDYWTPTHFTPQVASSHGSHYLNVVARLASGASVAAASEEMRRIAADLAREYPSSNTSVGAIVVPLKDDLLGDTRVELLVLMAAAAAVLLIASANLASLLLSRAAARRAELAVRSAIGATSGRLVRQMLVEGMVLSIAGGVLGIGVAAAGLRLMNDLVPRGILQPAATLDLRLLTFALLASLATGLLFSVVPALQAAHASVRQTLQHTGRSSVGTSGRVRDILVVAQVAAALALLVAAGLLLRTLANLTSVDLGFRTDGLLTIRTALPPTRYQGPLKRLAFYDRVVAAAKAVPGVDEAAYGSNPPFMSSGDTQSFSIDGRPPFGPGEPSDALLRVGTPDYLKALCVSLLAGRLLDSRDGTGAPAVVVINETMARTHWPNASPLGNRIHVGSAGPFTIVGVVADIRERGYEPSMKPGVYLSFAQFPTTWATPEYLVTRISGGKDSVAAALRQIVVSVDPDQPIGSVRTMDEIIGMNVADRRQQIALLASFAVLAVMLASIGLYGVLAYAVAQRTREIGLRLALGATTASVLRMVLGRGAALTGIGLAIGGALAWAAARTMASVLRGVTPGDPATYAAVVGMLATIGLVASYLPARRAARLDPSEVLRSD
jgi:putative ABC transport system permease protein